MKNFNKLALVSSIVMMAGSQTTFASDQSDSKGFVEDSKFTINARNFYMNRDNRAAGATRSYGEEWAQGFTGILESGFTQGTVGFGVGIIGMYGQKLDTGDGRYGGGTSLLEYDSHGAKDNYSKGGGVFKVRISNTVFKYGTQTSTIPVLYTNDGRLLPQTLDGFSLSSKEIKNLRVDAGHFTSLTGLNQSTRDSVGMTAVDYIGGVYNFKESVPGLTSSLYYAKTEEYWRKYYVNVNYLYPVTAGQTVNIAFNGYGTKSIEEARAGDLDNKIWSALVTYTIGAHGFSLGYQKVTGTGDYKYGPDGGSTYSFDNGVTYSDFDYENEKSVQARYDLNLAPYGIPGLTFMARYVKGYDFKDSVGGDIDGKAWERDMDIRYVVQSGPVKNLSVALRQASYRSGDRGGQLDDFRIITNYPINIF
ncbi:imipenem/basic amino acid-specific outer membrane pore [Pseudomonas sp. GV047]|nr:OprD family porin [Pseudomonas sp. GV047]PUB38807.1 imipenem/basic amino acid-specific outer membrane pore [Pseudomonas sp. GV047]